jgi:hypothetical protein
MVLSFSNWKALHESIQDPSKDSDWNRSEDFFKLFTQELDRLGIEWQDQATPRQKKNGTAKIVFRRVDGIKILLESDWEKLSKKPKQRARIISNKKEIIDLIEEDSIEMGSGIELLGSFPLEAALDSFGLPQYYSFGLGSSAGTITLYIFNRSIRADNYGDPSAHPIEFYSAVREMSLEEFLPEVLSRVILGEISLFLSHVNHLVNGTLINSNVKIPSNILENFIDKIGANQLSRRLGSRATPDEVFKFWKNIEVSQSYFAKLVRDPNVSETIKGAIYKNPNYFAPDDILSDWY